MGRTQVHVFAPGKDGNPWGAVWCGNRDATLDAAIAEAIASLSELIRDAAARLVTRTGELWLSSQNPRIVRRRPSDRLRS